jgi:hypothetical protein
MTDVAASAAPALYYVILLKDRFTGAVIIAIRTCQLEKSWRDFCISELTTQEHPTSIVEFYSAA